MRVFYRVPRCARRSAVTVYEATRVVFCCEEMKRHWGRLVGFGVRGCPHSTSRDVNLQMVRPQANGGHVVEVTPVAHCPWCGETVEICREK